jgi:microcystin-dependent protein
LFFCIGTTFGAGNGSTTFALPDLRGYFVRGSGINSDGTAAGNFGAKQADDFKSHNHTGSTSQNGSHNHTYNSHTATFNLQGGTSGGAVQNIMRNPDGNGQTSAVGNHSHTITAEGGTENRPRNIALLYCIKF